MLNINVHNQSRIIMHIFKLKIFAVRWCYFKLYVIFPFYPTITTNCGTFLLHDNTIYNGNYHIMAIIYVGEFINVVGVLHKTSAAATVGGPKWRQDVIHFGDNPRDGPRFITGPFISGPLPI